MSGSRCGSRRRIGRLGVLILSCGALTVAAHADPWVPPAGGGSFDFSLRQYEATRVFPPDRYGTATLPGSQERYTMLRITGTHGLGSRLSVEYDLRAARIEKIRIHHGRRVVERSVGAQDEQVGLDVALTQSTDFADSVSLSVVAPAGSVSAVPALGVGHTAIEPDFQIGAAGARWRASLKAGSRVFVDSGAAQMRAELDTGFRLTRRVELGALIFYVRTVGLRSPLPVADGAERYDLLRPGLRLKYRVTRRLKPFIEYEQDVAGQAIHAGRRITAGVTYAY